MIFIFFIGSVFGWVLELLFRRFHSPEKKWINPGFLMGPCLPIYGFGLCTLYLLAGLEKYIKADSGAVVKIILFAVMALTMTLIEYIAGLIFVKGLKTKLWDYSDRKFNLQGIICLEFSIIWALLSVIYYFFIHGHLERLVRWYGKNPQASFFIGIFFGIFAVDVVSSFKIVARIKQFADENGVLVRYEELKAAIHRTAVEQKKKYRFLRPFGGDEALREHLTKYLEHIKERGQEIDRKYKSITTKSGSGEKKGSGGNK